MCSVNPERSADIVSLNVGGRRFCTSKNTLQWQGNSFFTVLLSGHLPSCKDETGAYFIDRDPDLFAIILNYLRTNELNLMGVDLSTLRNEAQFYGLDSLVKKLSLCEESITGRCGDLLFHAYMPSPGFPAGVSEDGTRWDSGSPLDAQRSEQAPEQQGPCNTTSSPTGANQIASSSETTGLGRGNKSERILLRRTSLSDSHPDQNETSSTKHVEPGLQAPSKPITLIACHRNLLAVAYRDQVGLFFLRDPIGWHLVWLSPPLSAPIDRLALTSKATHPASLPTTMMSSMTNSTGSSVSPPVTSANNPFAAAAMVQSSTSISRSTGSSTVNTASSGSSPTISSSQPATLPGPAATSPGPNATQTASPTGLVLPVQILTRSNAGCLVAATIGSTITLWCVYSPYGTSAPAHVISCNASGIGGVSDASIASNKLYLCTLTRFSPDAAPGQPGHYAALPRAKQPWPSSLIGRYDLNGRAVDYLLFIGAHLVALSRRGLVGVRQVMTNTWQVWGTVPILSYGVAASELLLLGCANGRIYSINIQKFPLRIIDNDLLVTEMYCDPQQDPITALSVHISSKTASSTRNCMEIAYGTLSGRVCLIVQYPESMGYRPQLLQTFTVHRSMVTRVVLSERHLVSVCNEFNHVRTWAVTRFRGIISTQPGSTPIASFNITALDTTSSQQLVDSVLEAAHRCATVSKPNVSRDAVPAQSTALPTHNALRDQVPNQPQSQSQSFRFSTAWRRHGAHSRSPGRGAGPSGSSAERDQSTVSRSYSDRSEPLDASEIAFTPLDQAIARPLDSLHHDIVVIPRTSWFHEDPGNPSARTSLVTNGNRSTGYGDNCGLPTVPNQPTDAHGHHSVNRCQTFHGSTRHTSTERNDSGQPHSTSLPANTRAARRPVPSIDVHRYANDPGPYGEREDVLVFVQKLTPNAHQLFVRLASNGKRVCVIRSVDSVPITAFSVHEHDGSNRIGAHPRRYLFTGHADGAIQVWDLTTALSVLKQNISLANSGLGFDGHVSHSEYAGAVPLSLGNVGLPGTIGPSVNGSFGMTGNPSAGPLTNADCVPSWVGPGGPSSRELIRLLDSCHLVTSSGGSSVVGLSSERVTPADSLQSLCVDDPSDM